MKRLILIASLFVASCQHCPAQEFPEYWKLNFGYIGSYGSVKFPQGRMWFRKDSLLTLDAQGAPADSAAVNSGTISFTSAADTAAGDALKSVQRKITLQNIGGFAGDGVVPNYRLGVFDNAGSEFASFNGKTKTISGYLRGIADSSLLLKHSAINKYFPADSFMLASRPDTNLAKQWFNLPVTFNDTLFMATGKPVMFGAVSVKDSLGRLRFKVGMVDSLAIGTTTPGAKLHVYGTAGANMAGISSTALPTSGDELGVFTIKTNQGTNIWTQSIVSYAVTGKGLRVYNHGGSSGETSFEIVTSTGTNLIVTGEGWVAIGKGTPTARLDVNGAIKADTGKFTSGLKVGVAGTMFTGIYANNAIGWTLGNTVDTNVVSGVTVATRVTATYRGAVGINGGLGVRTVVDTLFIACIAADTALLRAGSVDYDCHK